MTIAIRNIEVSYITEVENTSAIIGGALIENFVGFANPMTSIVFTPVGGNYPNVLEALELSIDYAGRNGFVSEVLHGGSFGFLATQAAFIPLSLLQQAAGA
ncbi:MAG: hypothetical protein EA365_13320 [Gloeocapsa sp. DLM2.Bin57]|nr:MAG: hypothetical protein EA365_13320 [Gloeocapsa sp. DLM2.Bin57]